MTDHTFNVAQPSAGSGVAINKGRRGMKARFSRATLMEQLDSRISSLEREFGFQDGWGWARVERKPIEVVVAFGRYSELLQLREDFD